MLQDKPIEEKDENTEDTTQTGKTTDRSKIVSKGADMPQERTNSKRLG